MAGSHGLPIGWALVPGDRGGTRFRARPLAAALVLSVIASLAPVAKDSVARAAGGLSIGVPAGFYPSERDFPGSNKPMWDRLAAAGPAVGLVAIVDPGQPSTDYVDFVQRQRLAGQRVVVTLPPNGFGARLAALRQWLPVDGVFLNATSALCTDVSATEIQQARAGGSLVIADLGFTTPGACWKPLLDVLSITSTWNGSSVPARPPWWTPGDSPQLWYRQLNVAQGVITAVADSARSQSATYLFTTPQVQFTEADLIPAAAYWQALVSEAFGSFAGWTDPVTDVVEQRTAVPLYGPSHPSWPTIHASPTREVPVVLVNVSNGPGTGRLAAVKADIDTARAGGKLVLGYLHTGYGTRANSLSLAEAQEWLSFYGVDGFFIDELSPECAAEPNVRALITGLRGLKPGAPVVLNPGRNLAECFLVSSGASAVVVFEGPLASFATWTPSTWSHAYPATRFWHILYATPATDLATVSQLSRRRNASILFANTLAFPTQWETALDTGAWSTLLTLNRTRPGRRTVPIAGGGSGSRSTVPPAAVGPTTPRSPAPPADGTSPVFPASIDAIPTAPLESADDAPPPLPTVAPLPTVEPAGAVDRDTMRRGGPSTPA